MNSPYMLCIALSCIIEIVSFCYLGYHVRSFIYEDQGNIFSSWKRYWISSGNRGMLFTRLYLYRREDNYELYSLIIQTFLLIIMILLAGIIVPFFWARSKKTVSTTTYMTAPKPYQTGSDIRNWFELFELYLNASNIRDDNHKCNILISKLDSDTNQRLKFYVTTDGSSDSLVNSRYSLLKSALINFFGRAESNPSDDLNKFAQRCQRPNENIHIYYSRLNELSLPIFKSFGSSHKDRIKLVNRRFVDGLSNANLRSRLMEIIEDPTNNQEILTVAERFERFYSSKQIGTSVVNQAKIPINNPVSKIVPSFKGQIQCHGCRMYGHVKHSCPYGRRHLETYRPNIDVERIVLNSKDALSRVREMNGTCIVDGVSCAYLIDTGTSRTIIRESMIPMAVRKDIVLLQGSVFTFDGVLSSINGSKSFSLQIGNTVCNGEFLVSKDLLNDCLLGMDVLTRCPLFKNAIEVLYRATNALITSSPAEVYVLDVPEIVPPINLRADVCRRVVNSEEVAVNNPVDPLVEQLKSNFHDLSATSMKDLTKLTNFSNKPFLQHEMLIKPGIEPIKQKTRGVPYSYREEFRNSVMEMKEAGLIVDSNSPWCSPVRLVKKKDGSIRICVDYRKVNNVTIKDAYPIPKIEDIFTYLNKAKIFT